MATLPEGVTIGADTDVTFEDYPTYTYYVDPLTRQISRMTDGLEAMVQAVEIIMSVERYKFQIYTPNFGIEFEGLIGEPFGFVISELKRRINDALSVDNRITETKDFVFDAEPLEGELTLSFTVVTVFGDFEFSTILEIS